MRKIVRLTESELIGIIRNSALRVIREDILGNDWVQDDEGDTDVFNNYEPFEEQTDDSDDEFDL